MFRRKSQMSKNYKEIITDNINTYGGKAGYAYHYTDVTNAVNILATGYLYSRQKCNEKNLMQNDNASSSVIGNTSTATKDDVRFYFRPLTPTQYYNEGYKHPQIRFSSDINANVPVPIFFLFDLQKMLENIPELRFTPMGRAGYSNMELLNGIESFSNLPFDKIYSTGFYDKDIEGDLKVYRHAELAVSKKFEVLPYIKHIVCRNEIEYFTLINLLRDSNKELFRKYQAYILNGERVVLPLFERNGLFVTDIRLNFNAGDLVVYFANYPDKMNYDRKFQNFQLQQIVVNTEVSGIIENKPFTCCFKNEINYIQPQKIKIDIPNMCKIDFTGIKIYFDKCLMAYKKFS